MDSSQAKTLYTNDIQRFYKVVYDILHVKQQNIVDLSNCIKKIASLGEKYLSLVPKNQQIHTDQLFVILTPIGLHPDVDSVDICKLFWTLIRWSIY